MAALGELYAWLQRRAQEEFDPTPSAFTLSMRRLMDIGRAPQFQSLCLGVRAVLLADSSLQTDEAFDGAAATAASAAEVELKWNELPHHELALYLSVHALVVRLQIYLGKVLPEAWDAALKSGHATDSARLLGGGPSADELGICEFSLGRLGGWTVLKLMGRGRKVAAAGPEAQFIRDLAAAMEDPAGFAPAIQFETPSLVAKVGKRVAVKADVLTFLKVLLLKLNKVTTAESLYRWGGKAYNVWESILEADPELWQACLVMCEALGIPCLAAELSRATAAEGSVEDPHILVMVRRFQGAMVQRFLHAMVFELLKRHKMGRKGEGKKDVATRAALNKGGAKGQRPVAVGEAGEEEEGAPQQAAAKRGRGRQAAGPAAASAVAGAARAAAAAATLLPPVELAVAAALDQPPPKRQRASGKKCDCGRAAQATGCSLCKVCCVGRTLNPNIEHPQCMAHKQATTVARAAAQKQQPVIPATAPASPAGFWGAYAPLTLPPMAAFSNLQQPPALNLGALPTLNLGMLPTLRPPPPPPPPQRQQQQQAAALLLQNLMRAHAQQQQQQQQGTQAPLRP